MRTRLAAFCISALIISCASTCSRIPLATPDGEEPAGKETAKEYKPFSFIQISDPQLGFLNGNNDYAADSLLLERTVAQINRLKPAFVVVTGDMTNASRNKAQIACYKKVIAKVSKKIPVYHVPGNHDIGSGSTDDKLASYIANYGSDHFDFTYDGCKFIGINSCIIKDENAPAEAVQLEWLEKTLSGAADARARFIFTHYSFFLKSWEEETNYSNQAPAVREKYWTLFKRNKVDCVIAGHLHDNKVAAYNGIGMITTGPVGKPLGKGYSGAMIWTIDGMARYSYEYLSVDELENRDKLLK